MLNCFKNVYNFKTTIQAFALHKSCLLLDYQICKRRNVAVVYAQPFITPKSTLRVEVVNCHAMLSFKRVFPRAAANVIGMVHALPMPATPLYEGARGVEAIVERATAEAKLYSGTNNLRICSRHRCQFQRPALATS